MMKNLVFRNQISNEVLKVSGCGEVGCGKRGKSECLVGKRLEGVW